uniref:CP072 protein n=1 Tax=Labrus bergylta TaxID=56723 RepID=A0A3Q3ERD5_9LABR
MEERKKEEGEAEIQEHGPEHWFSKWERQCLAEAEQGDPNEEETEQSQQKLWHLFQNSATAVAQLYKDRVCQQQGLSLWVPFQNAATAVTNLYKESMEARQRSYDLGIHLGYQRRNKDVIAWVKKRRRTIRREDLISFLCGKVPPPRTTRAPPRVAMVSASRPTQPETGSSVETDLQPFREAIALQGRMICHVEHCTFAFHLRDTKIHTVCCGFICIYIFFLSLGLSGAMASISVRSGPPGSPTHPAQPLSRRRNGLHDVDLNTFIAEEMALHLDSTANRKRGPAPCSDVITDSPTHKRNRML